MLDVGENFPPRLRKYFFQGGMMRIVESLVIRVSIVRDLIMFFYHNKWWWLIPMVLVLLLFSALIIVSQYSAIAPFIYTLF